MDSTLKRICVFCSSSAAISDEYFDLATELGYAIADRNYSLVYGGARVGLMGAVAEAVQQRGGRIVGILPEALHQRKIAFETCTELVIVTDMRARKAAMEDQSNAFIALPGGFGTLEELLEIITLKQLRYHEKPVVILNHGGFFDPLLSLFEHLYDHRFAKSAYRDLYFVADDVEAAFTYIDAYEPPELVEKWSPAELDGLPRAGKSSAA